MSSYSVVKEGMNNIPYQKEVTLMKGKRGAKSSSNAFKRLKELPFFDELDRRIKMNIAVEELAKWIQEDRMQMTDIKRDSLVRQLYRYKAAIPPGEIAEVEPMFFAKSIEKLKRGVNEIEELEKLYLFQLRRISMDGATEEKINKLFSGMNKEIQLAADLLNKLIEKKMELGILSREPQKFSFTGGIGTMDLSQNGELDDDTRVRMGMVAGKLVNMLSKMMEEPKSEEVEDEDEV